MFNSMILLYHVFKILEQKTTNCHSAFFDQHFQCSFTSSYGFFL